MKNKKEIFLRITYKRFLIRIKRQCKKKEKRKIAYEQFTNIQKELQDDFSYENILNTWLPKNIKYLLSCKQSDFYFDKLKENIPKHNGKFEVPSDFSIISNPDESYSFIQQVTASLIYQLYNKIEVDYGKCEKIDLGTEVFFDVIIKEIFEFFDKCSRHKKTRSKVDELKGRSSRNADVNKLLFSVGSPAIHAKKTISYPDIIPYKLCFYDGARGSYLGNAEQKEIDTTELVEYVLESLKRVNKELTPEKRDDLAIVIGEILINAEEHSTTNCRFSIGYFHEMQNDGKHYGVLRLAILNFGKTIYETFKDPNCPNKIIVKKMKELSDGYNKRGLFFNKEFEEETLWTLYALQEGVTSIDPKIYSKRGNGSIQFIESFFNIKGSDNLDNVSRMTIHSGHTDITFNGSYNITEKIIEGDKYKFMTFNKTGSIKDKPDQKFVQYVDNYFPGTMICAEILFNEGDYAHDN